MAHTITLIPGDGIGPEITDATVRVLDATGVGFEWEKHEGGIRAFERTGNPLPEELLESIRRNGLALKGPLTTLVGEGFPSANVALRKGLNLYGDIVSDLAAGLVGGLGVVPAANIGESHAVFEAVHGTAPDIAGKGIANPTALIFSGVMMLRHIGENEAADRVLAACFRVLQNGDVRTPDLGGSASTSEYADAVLRELASQ